MKSKLNFSRTSCTTLLNSEFWEESIFDSSIEVDINELSDSKEVKGSLKIIEKEKEYDSNSSLKSSPVFFYLRKIGDAQIQVLENFFQIAMESMPCTPLGTFNRSNNSYNSTLNTVSCQSFANCKNPLKYFTLQKCDESFDDDLNCVRSYSKDNKSKSMTTSRADYNPFNHNIVGPKSCEFCHSSSTLHCTSDCERPKLFLRKKRPPFENDRDWDPITEYHIDDLGIDLNL